MAASVIGLPPPGVLRYSLLTPTARHAPTVAAGDRVRAGDEIARGLHAAAAGVVELTATAILVHVDGSDERAPTLSEGDFAERVRRAGIVGLGGSGYPADRKLLDARAKGVPTVIVNAVECEPGVSADRALLAAHLPEILRGLRAVAEYLGGARGVLAVGEGEGMEGADGIEVVRVTGRYPTGSERSVVARVIGADVPKDGFPTDVGAVVFNAATVYAIDRAWSAGEPLMQRVVTVGDENYWVPVGHPVAELPLPPGEKMVGGPVTGRLAEPDAAVEKTTRAVTPRPKLRSMPCIRCGWCASACPEGLLPQELFARIETERWPEADALRLEDCVECGACDLACPSRLPLLATFRFGKSERAETTRRAEAAEVARARYEARGDRLARIEAETRGRRAERLARPRQWKR